MIRLRQILARLPVSGEARHALRQFNLAPKNGGQVPSVRPIFAVLGLDVGLADLPKNVRGRMMRDPFAASGWRVEINRLDDVRVQRFTALHELGHFLFHRDDSDPFAPSANRASRTSDEFWVPDPKLELEANQVAAAIMFDDGALQAARTLLGDDVQALAKHFGTTEKVVEIALRQGW